MQAEKAGDGSQNTERPILSMSKDPKSEPRNVLESFKQVGPGQYEAQSPRRDSDDLRALMLRARMCLHKFRMRYAATAHINREDQHEAGLIIEAIDEWILQQ